MSEDKQTIQIGDIALSVDEVAETLSAIRGGKVDAVVVEGIEGHEIFTFRDPSHPFRLLVEAMSEGALLTTLEGIVSYQNPRFSELVGIDTGSMQGRSISDVVWPECRLLLAEVLERARAQGTARGNVDLVAADGGPLSVLLSVSCASLADVDVFCVVVTDLTEQRLQEELYRSARHEIEARDRLFAVASHELRNPLNVVEMQAQLLSSLLETAGDGPTAIARARDLVRKLRRQTHRLAQLVTNLLDVGSIGAGHLALAPEELDLSDLVRSALELSRDDIERSGSDLTLDLQRARGCWDRVRVEQVIENLVSNAAKYGLGRPIHVSVTGTETAAYLRVEDQGRGIPTEARERIFRPYERLTHGPAMPGLGIGLYVTAEIVKSHGGTIRAEGRPGGGTVFTVELPVDPPRELEA